MLFNADANTPVFFDLGVIKEFFGTFIYNVTFIGGYALGIAENLDAFTECFFHGDYISQTQGLHNGEQTVVSVFLYSRNI